MKLLKFWAEWCAPCKALSEQFKSLSLPVPVEEINIDDADNDILTKYKVRSIPLLILVDDEGKELWRNTGYITGVNLEDQLDKIINTEDKNEID